MRPVSQVLIESSVFVERFGEWVEEDRSKNHFSTHDSFGRIIKREFYEPDDSLQSLAIYERDESGTLLTVNTYLPDGALFARTTYEYDNQDGGCSVYALFGFDDGGQLFCKWHVFFILVFRWGGLFDGTLPVFSFIFRVCICIRVLPA